MSGHVLYFVDPLACRSLAKPGSLILQVRKEDAFGVYRIRMQIILPSWNYGRRCAEDAE